MKIGKWILGAALAGLFAAAPPGFAHGIWFAQRADDLALIYGEGGDDLDMVKRLPLIRRLDAYAADGSPVAISLKPTGKIPALDLTAAPAIVASVLDNGIWTRSTEGRWHKKPKGEVANAQHSSENFKYAVHWRLPLQHPMQAIPGHDLQLIPLSPAMPTHKGEHLALRVVFRGQACAGAKVIADFVNDPDAEPLTSDPDGLVIIPVRNQGLNVIAAEITAPPKDATLTDAAEHLATLSFRLAHAPE